MKYLFVIDVQNDFITGALGTREAQETMPNIVKEIQEKVTQGYKVILTRDTHYKNTYMKSLEGQKLPILHCVENTWGWEISPRIMSVIPDDSIFVNKNTFGTFDICTLIADMERAYELKDFLAPVKNVDEIEIIGFCSDICVISNALILRAAYRNTPIIIKKNCCAGVTPEKHEAAMQVLESCQIDIV